MKKCKTFIFCLVCASSPKNTIILHPRSESDLNGLERQPHQTIGFLAHDALITTISVFESCMKYLYDNNYIIVFMRALTGYMK
jgi:hypothetical protein